MDLACCYDDCQGISAAHLQLRCAVSYQGMLQQPCMHDFVIIRDDQGGCTIAYEIASALAYMQLSLVPRSCAQILVDRDDAPVHVAGKVSASAIS